MGPIAIITGLVLIADGVIPFLTSSPADGKTPWTALIPAGFGAVLVVLGWLARNDKIRMHVMHAAVLVGLIGAVSAIAILTIQDFKAYSETGAFDRPVATIAKAIMAVTCVVFVGLCVKSFIDARRRRIAGEITAPSQS